MLPAVERILLTLWVGSLWVTGFMVAPLLFATLDDRSLAGTIAGKLFGITAWVGLSCGVVLLLIRRLRSGSGGWRAWVIAAMLVLVCAGQFVLAPMIAELRAAGMTDTSQFGRLHGVASMLFVVTAVLGLWLVAAGQEREISH
ncbi:MAG: DUF4149 domain-containing protein [Gammaproteobacteria bacterium]|nr:DUF4149 domain-containing protein [Gammaproteobacteria bacterium]